MALQVIQAGLFTTVQDLGRPGYRGRGVPVGGVFDRHSAKIANALLGNPWNCSVLEFTTFGGIYEAETSLGLAVAGAPLRIEIRKPAGRIFERPVPSSFRLTPGSRLEVGGTRRGARCYLAVVGGWKTGMILGSRSTESRFVTGERLDADPSTTYCRTLSIDPWEWPMPVPLRFIEGPDRCSKADLDGRDYVVLAESSRMGIRLEGSQIEVLADPDRLSAPVAPGAIQVAGSLPMILGVAGGTLGGYPHIGHLISADLDRLAQIAPGDRVRFKKVSLVDARAIDRRERLIQARRALQIQAMCLDRGGD